MHFDRALWTFTAGVRSRIAWATIIGLLAVGLGMARLMLLAWLIAEVFAGRDLTVLMLPIAGIGAIMILRGAFEHARVMVAHETAARVQKHLRRVIYDKIATLGPGAVARRRSGALALSLIDGVERLEVYFGQFLPQFLVSLLAPVLIFAVIAWIDLPVALVMVAAAPQAMALSVMPRESTFRPSTHMVRRNSSCALISRLFARALLWPKAFKVARPCTESRNSAAKAL